mgnify:FL=1
MTIEISINPLEAIRTLIKPDFDALNALIQKQLYTDVPLVEDMSHYIVNSGGKRIRPMMALLAAKTLGYPGDQHILLAAIVEFIHTATLLHDDVVDQAEQRRGKKTANAVWNNGSAVLVGDFLYSRAFQMMVELGTLDVMDIFATTTNKISEGEVLQLMNCGNLALTEKEYFQTIYYKTAKLFEATTQLTAVVHQAPAAHIEAMATYGKQFGIAYQLTDDALDYEGDSDHTGKNIGQDLSEGKLTLPLIYALEQGTLAQQALIKTAIQNKSLEHLNQIQAAIQETHAITYTRTAAHTAVQTACDALENLPPSNYRQAMKNLALFLIERMV